MKGYQCANKIVLKSIYITADYAGKNILQSNYKQITFFVSVQSILQSLVSKCVKERFKCINLMRLNKYMRSGQ